MFLVPPPRLVGNVEDDVITFITRQWDKLRINLPQLIRDIYCFGWSAAEKIWMIERGYAVMCIKPLEAAITGLLIDPSTGRLSGLVQPLVLGVSNGPAVGLPIKLDLQHAVVFSYQPHGSNWYGTSILESVRQSYNSHRDADEGASRYDRNISGSHWLVTYPDGVMVDFNGVQTPAGEVAQHLLASLESSGAVTIPSATQNVIGQLNSEAVGWKIELLSDSTPRQPAFVARMDYLDKLKCRGMGFPEKSMLEGNSGNKAESTVHTDVGLSILEQRHAWLIQECSKQIIDDLLVQNYGIDYAGKVRLVPNSIQKDSQQILGEVYKQVLAGNPAEAANIDMQTLRDNLKIASVNEIEGGVEDLPDGSASPAITDKVVETYGLVGVTTSLGV